jgi:hypothetical protein
LALNDTNSSHVQPFLQSPMPKIKKVLSNEASYSPSSIKKDKRPSKLAPNQNRRKVNIYTEIKKLKRMQNSQKFRKIFST